MSELKYCSACIALALDEAERKLESVRAKLREPIPSEPSFRDLLGAAALTGETAGYNLFRAKIPSPSGVCRCCDGPCDLDEIRDRSRLIGELRKLNKKLLREAVARHDAIRSQLKFNIKAARIRREAEEVARYWARHRESSYRRPSG